MTVCKTQYALCYKKSNIKYYKKKYLFKQIELTPSKETAKPGDDYSLTVATSKNSFVSILGIDQSVLILADGKK